MYKSCLSVRGNDLLEAVKETDQPNIGKPYEEGLSWPVSTRSNALKPDKTAGVRAVCDA